MSRYQSRAMLAQHLSPSGSPAVSSTTYILPCGVGSWVRGRDEHREKIGAKSREKVAHVLLGIARLFHKKEMHACCPVRLFRQSRKN